MKQKNPRSFSGGLTKKEFEEEIKEAKKFLKEHYGEIKKPKSFIPNKDYKSKIYKLQKELGMTKHFFENLPPRQKSFKSYIRFCKYCEKYHRVKVSSNSPRPQSLRICPKCKLKLQIEINKKHMEWINKNKEKIKEEWRRKIIGFLKKNKSAMVKDLRKEFKIKYSSILNSVLKSLEEEKKISLIRKKGGEIIIKLFTTVE